MEKLFKLVKKQELSDGSWELTFECPEELLEDIKKFYGDSWQEKLTNDFIETTKNAYNKYRTQTLKSLHTTAKKERV